MKNIFSCVLLVNTLTCVLAVTSADAEAASAKDSSAVSKLEPNPLQSTDPNSQVTVSSLCADSRFLATNLGIMPLLEELDSLSTKDGEHNSMRSLLLKQEIVELLVVTNYEIRFVTNRIDKELAETNEILAYLAERRDRAIRVNTYANFISGGLTGIVRGGMDLGNIVHVPPNTIEVAEGTIQSSLAGWAYHQQLTDKRLEQGVPNMLAKFMNKGEQRPTEFPASIWGYLNAVPADGKSTSTRRAKLIKRWIDRRMCLLHPAHREKTELRAARVSGSEGKPRTVDIGILEDRVAMLTELRCAVTGMENLLLEISRSLRSFGLTGGH